MAAPKRTAAQIAENRRRIIHLYYDQKMTQAEIGELLGLSQQMISYDIRAIKKEWKAERVDALSAIKADVRRRIERIAAVAWKETGEPGDRSAEWIRVVEWTIERIIKLYGLDAPLKMAPTTPSGEEEYRGLTDDRMQEFADSIFERARERATGEPGEGRDPVDPDAGASD